ncbi:hypothetical protein [Desulfosoma sp.]
MGKKRKSMGERGLTLSENERAELSFFMDRLRMQDPQGASLENCLKSLKQALSHREELAAALLEALSREGGEVCFRAFCELRGIVRDKRLEKIVRQAAFRFRQKGFPVPRESASIPDASPVALIKADAVKNECVMAAAPNHHAFQYAAYVYSRHNAAYATVLVIVGPAFQCEGLALLHESRRSFRDFVKSVAQKFESRLQDIPLGHVARVVEDLAAMGRIPPDHASDLKKVQKLLDQYRLEDPRPYFLQLWERKGLGPLRELDEDALIHFLAEQPLVMPRNAEMPRTTALQAAVKELESIRDGVLEVPEYIKRERERERVRDITGRLMSREFCRLLGRHWEEYALWRLLEEDFSTAEKLYRLAEHVSAVTEPGSSRVMVRYLELLMVILFQFATEDLLDQLRELIEPLIEDEEASEGWKTPSGLYVPGGLIK